MIKVKIENVSQENHHTVRLTPANGETVDPTTLIGAALWADDLSICLSPLKKDLTCFGTDEVITFEQVPADILNYYLTINDQDMGMVGDAIQTIQQLARIDYSEITGRLSIENLTSECVRYSLGGNGTINLEEFVVAPESQTAYHVVSVDPSNSFETLDIHLGPTRLNSVAVDFLYRAAREDSNASAGFPASPYECIISTASLLPATGITFELGGQEYALDKGQTEISIPFTLPENITRYPYQYTPDITVTNPEFLLGGTLPTLDEITVRPTGFNYGIEVGYGLTTDGIERQAGYTDAYTGYLSLYRDRVVDRLYLGTDREYFLQFDPSFAGAQLHVPRQYAMDSYLGTIDGNGRIEFQLAAPILGRKEIDISFYLTDGDDPRPFFNIYGIFSYPNRPYINSDTIGSPHLGWNVSITSGYGNLITFDSIPPTILEIEVSNDRWGHAPDDVTAFHKPKRLTRDSGSVPFTMIPDKPLRAYSSSAGSMLYYLNYIQVKFVENGIVSDRGMWYEYKLNVFG